MENAAGACLKTSLPSIIASVCSEDPEGTGSAWSFAYYLLSNRAGLELRPSSGSQPTCQPTVVRMGEDYMWEDISSCWVVTCKNHIYHIPRHRLAVTRSPTLNCLSSGFFGAGKRRTVPFTRCITQVQNTYGERAASVRRITSHVG